MQISFLQDYQGYLVPGHFYRKGETVDLQESAAMALIEAGRASQVESVPPQVPEEIVVDKRKPGRPKKAQT